MRAESGMNRRIKRSVAMFIVAAVVISVIALISENTGAAVCTGGVADLSKWDFEKDGMARLNGEWEFLWQDEKEPHMVKVPSPWNLQKKDETGNFPVEGYGVYHLRVITSGTGQQMGLKLGLIPSSYQLFIDDRPVYSCGSPGIDKQSSIPEWEMKTVCFMPSGGEIDIKIMVSNYHYGRGGLSLPIGFGTMDSINNYTNNHMFIEVFLFGAIFIIGVMFMAMYFFGGRNRSHMYMGIFAVAMSFRPVMYGEVFLLRLFPNIPWEIFNKLFIINLGTVQFMLLSIYSTYKKYTSKKLIACSLILQNTALAAGLLLGSRWMISSTFAMEALVAAGTAYMIYVMVKSAADGDRWSLMILSQLAVLTSVSVLDMVTNSHIIGLNYYYNPFGILFFTVVVFIILAVQHKENMDAAERLKREVSIRNISLNMEIKQRLLSEQINRVACDIMSTLDLNEVLDRLLNHLYKIIPFTAAYIMLKEGDKLKVCARKVMEGSGWVSEKYKYMAWNEGLEGPFFAKKAVVLETINNGEAYTSRVLPLYYNREPLGIFEIYRPRDRDEGLDDTNIIEVFADQAAIAINNARLYSTLKEYANVDTLTEAFTRRYFKELVDTIMDDLRIEGRCGSLVMIDVDHFKGVNDKYGHISGDTVLKTIVQRCMSRLPEDAVIARYGGEEFIIFFPYTGRDRIVGIMEGCREEIRSKPVAVKQNSINITVSMGIAFQQHVDETLEQLIKRADEALYGAKRNGRDCICY